MNPELISLYRAVLETHKDRLSFQEKKDLLNDIRKLVAPDENRWNFRYVIWILALVALSVPAAAFWLIYLGKGDVPQALLSLGSTAVGALAALLAPHFKRKDEPQDSSPLRGDSARSDKPPANHMVERDAPQAGAPHRER